MINTSEVRHFACVWFVPGDGFDFMGMLYQKHDASWEMCYLFRYYARTGSVDPFEGDDEKSWYLVKFKVGTKVPEMEASMDEVIAKALGLTGLRRLKVEKVEVRGDASKFVEVMSKQSWAHMKFEPKPGSVSS